VIIEFTTINIPYAAKSQSLTAIAVDPESARTVLASEVNQHYIQRYGALFLSNMLQGYAEAISDSGSTQTQNDTTGQTETTNATYSSQDKLFIALGKVGEALSQAAGEYFNRPTTISINEGTPIGLLILQDFTIG
jgi:intracellular multiplication protein IcmE